MLLSCCCRIIRTKVQQPFHPTPDGAGTGVTAPGHTIGKRAQGRGEADPPESWEERLCLWEMPTCLRSKGRALPGLLEARDLPGRLAHEDCSLPPMSISSELPCLYPSVCLSLSLYSL